MQLLFSRLPFLSWDIGKEVSINYAGGPEDLLDIERLLASPVDGVLQAVPVHVLQTVELAARREVGALEPRGEVGGEPHRVILRVPLPVRVEKRTALQS